VAHVLAQPTNTSSFTGGHSGSSGNSGRVIWVLYNSGFQNCYPIFIRKKGNLNFGVPEISGSGFPEIPDQLLSLYLFHQTTSRKSGSNKKARSTYQYYCTNRTNKQSTNQPNKFLIGLWGEWIGP
jgi:hypothetical protein